MQRQRVSGCASRLEIASPMQEDFGPVLCFPYQSGEDMSFGGMM
jgi:hypothetical protein